MHGSRCRTSSARWSRARRARSRSKTIHGSAPNRTEQPRRSIALHLQPASNRFVERTRPDVILTQGPKDTHQEHRIIWDICLAAARRVPASILHHAVVSNTADFTPNVFVDIAEQYEGKQAALAKPIYLTWQRPRRQTPT